MQADANESHGNPSIAYLTIICSATLSPSQQEHSFMLLLCCKFEMEELQLLKQPMFRSTGCVTQWESTLVNTAVCVWSFRKVDTSAPSGLGSML